ncbi:MAG: hypothetical protein ACLSAP_11920 [Oscillospiraceae bacterium]
MKRIELCPDDAEISFANHDDARLCGGTRENTEWQQACASLSLARCTNLYRFMPIRCTLDGGYRGHDGRSRLKLTVSSGTRPVGASAVASIINRATCRLRAGKAAQRKP